MIRLRVKDLAESRGMTLSTIQREAKLPVSTARRYWWSSRTGLQRDAGTLNEVNLLTLGAIAGLLDVRPGDLLSDS
jgi:DNA-binding Xre family transcriptional regulator